MLYIYVLCKLWYRPRCLTFIVLSPFLFLRRPSLFILCFDTKDFEPHCCVVAEWFPHSRLSQCIALMSRLIVLATIFGPLCPFGRSVCKIKRGPFHLVFEKNFLFGPPVPPGLSSMPMYPVDYEVVLEIVWSIVEKLTFCQKCAVIGVSNDFNPPEPR